MSCQENFADGESSKKNLDNGCSVNIITPYICDKCGLNFQTMASVLSHVKWKHENPPFDPMCSVCQRIFTRKYDRDRHQKNCQDRFRVEKKNIVCSFCDFCAPNRNVALTHYRTEHNLNIDKKVLNFDTFEEFLSWKEKFEKDTKSRYIQTSGIRPTKSGVNTVSYKCHRDGNFQSKSKGIRRMKRIGSNKINSYCPARITVTQGDQTVRVVYIDTHVGHELDLCHLYISESEKADIAKKLAMKIPFRQILDDIRESTGDGELDRIHLATRYDLWNIAKSYNLNHEGILHKNNYLSVKTWMLHIQKSSNVVRFYKPQGEVSKNFPQLRKKDFILVVMNDTQKEMLQKFGNDCVCIDSTHDLNVREIQLYTVMVLDDMGQGFPCSFLFSNRTDTVAMEIIFAAIQDCLCNTSIQPKTFLSDMNHTFLNAWSAIVGPVQNSLFCSWLVDRIWRKNLSKIENKEKQAVIYKKMKIIMHEGDIDTFSVMVNNLLEEFRSDTDCLEFLECFETYVEKCTSWAYCYQSDNEINASTNLENLHLALKHIYYEENVKRMDEAITTLMGFIRDKLFHKIVALSNTDISEKLASIRQIHKKSIGLHTIIDLGNSWSICATNCEDTYKVEAANTTCSCELQCQECESCIHSYTCNCIDFSLNWDMCEHIHSVCMFLKNDNSVIINRVDGNTSREVIKCEIDHIINDNVSDEDSDKEAERIILSVVSEDKHSFDNRKQDVMNKFLEVYNTIENEEQLEAVLKHVVYLESIVNAVSKKKFPNRKNRKEPPNKKIKHE